MGTLSPEQMQHFEERGYVVVPRVLADDEMDRYRARARAIALGELPEEARNRVVRDIAFAKGKLPLPEDPERAIWKIVNPDRFDPLFEEALRFPRVLDAASSLIGDDILAFLLMFIYKPPGVPGSDHPFHQDALYFPFGPHDQCVGAWIPLDPVNADNGTLTVVPGSHKMEVLRHGALEGINRGSFAAEGVEDNEEFHRRAVSLELPPGDCVLFSSRMLHRTSGNRTDGHRRVITLHLANARCKPVDPDRQFTEYAFACVRGRTYEGCLQPHENKSLKMANAQS